MNNVGHPWVTFYFFAWSITALTLWIPKLQNLEYVWLRPKSNPVAFQFQSLTCTKCMVLQKTAHTWKNAHFHWLNSLLTYCIMFAIWYSVQHFDQISQQLWYGKFMLKDKLLIYHLLSTEYIIKSNRLRIWPAYLMLDSCCMCVRKNASNKLSNFCNVFQSDCCMNW